MKRQRNESKSITAASPSSLATAKSSSSNWDKFTQQLKQVKEKKRGTSSSFSSKQVVQVDFDKKKRTELVKHFQANYDKRYSIIQYRFIDMKVDKELLKKSNNEEIEKNSEDRKKTCDGIYSIWKRQYFVRGIVEELTRSICNGGSGFDLFNFPNLSVELIHLLLCLNEKKKDSNQSTNTKYSEYDIVNNFQLPNIYDKGGENQTSSGRFRLSFFSGMRTGKNMVLLNLKSNNSAHDESMSEALKKQVTHSSLAISRAVSVYQLFQAPRLSQHFYDDYGNYTCIFSIHGTASRYKSHPSTSHIKHKAQLYSAVKSLAISNRVIVKPRCKSTTRSPPSQSSTLSPSSSVATTSQQPFLKTKEHLYSKNLQTKNSNKKGGDSSSHSVKSSKDRKRRKIMEREQSMMVDEENHASNADITTNKASDKSKKKAKQERKFTDYLPLHEMWREYMKSTLGPSSLINNEIMLKVDYHGCIFKVVKSHCGSYVGKEGMLIKETENTFQILTREDKLFTIPKNGSVFQFNFEKLVKPSSGVKGKESNLPPETKNYQIEIIGTQFCFRSYDRASKKFKRRDVIDL